MLTFQGKQAAVPLKEIWTFITCTQERHKTPEQTILSKVKENIGIRLDSVTLLSKTTSRQYFYGELTDKNVNEITRGDNQMVNFFAIHEVDSLDLDDSSRILWLKHKHIITKPFSV